MKKIIVLILSTMLFCAATHRHPEKYYQEKWCTENNGKTEYVLPDRTRCDCLTETHAIEFDFGEKWAEAIGQSLYYSLQTGKRAGIVLSIAFHSKLDVRCSMLDVHLLIYPLPNLLQQTRYIMSLKILRPGNLFLQDL